MRELNRGTFQIKHSTECAKEISHQCSANSGKLQTITYDIVILRYKNTVVLHIINCYFVPKEILGTIRQDQGPIENMDRLNMMFYRFNVIFFWQKYLRIDINKIKKRSALLVNGIKIKMFQDYKRKYYERKNTTHIDWILGEIAILQASAQSVVFRQTAPGKSFVFGYKTQTTNFELTKMLSLRTLYSEIYINHYAISAVSPYGTIYVSARGSKNKATFGVESWCVK